LIDVPYGSAQLMQHEFHPQLAGLVLHDKQHFVVIWRQWLLRVQNVIQLQIITIAHGLAEVERALAGVGAKRASGHGGLSKNLSDGIFV
jgi:hypothetical protein